jgi:hypothetical protein
VEVRDPAALHRIALPVLAASVNGDVTANGPGGPGPSQTRHAEPIAAAEGGRHG